MTAQADAIKQDAATHEVDWEVVYGELLPRVYNFFRYRVGDGPQAEDLTATTFEKAWRARNRYRRELAAFSTWLFTIARHVAADYLRQPRIELSLEELGHPPANDSPEEIISRRSDFERLAVLLAELPARERELIALKYGAGFNNREIAQFTGLGESNVGTILYRVVQNLRGEWRVE